MQCGHCGGTIRLYEFQKKSGRNECVSCEKCGSSHTYSEGTVTPINPRPLPCAYGAVVMPWRDASTRPIEPGMYECRFRNLEHLLLLEWTGTQFEHEGQRVNCRTLQAWRGSWE